MLQVIRNGSRNVDVALLQALLNKQPAAPRLTVDGIFGNLTERALRRYQDSKPSLSTDGVAGSGTWGSFPSSIREIRHNRQLRAQTGTMGCWSAAAGMMTTAPMTQGPNGARLEPGGGMTPTLANLEHFVRSMGWRMRNNQSRPSSGAIATAMARGPIWVVFQGRTFAHAVVFTKMLSDGTDAGTAFEVMDPWPVGRGTKYYTGYANGIITLRSDSSRPQAMIAHMAGP